MKNYIGSSSIFAFSHLSRVMEEEGLHKPEERIQQIGELVRGSWLCVGNDPAEDTAPAACYKAAPQY